MIGDYGRETSVFGTSKGYDGVRFFSGRPIVASDLNENGDLQTWQREQALIDVIGRFGVPKHGGGFSVGTRSSGALRLAWRYVCGGCAVYATHGAGV